MSREFILDGKAVKFSAVQTADSVTVQFNGTDYDFQRHDSLSGYLTLRCGDKMYRLRSVKSGEKIAIWINGRVVELTIPADETAGDHAHASDEIRAPMPGTLIRLITKPGDEVEVGQTVAIVEAMKMEHNLRAPRAGRVQTVNGIPGAQVDSGAVIVILEAQD